MPFNFYNRNWLLFVIKKGARTTSGTRTGPVNKTNENKNLKHGFHILRALFSALDGFSGV